MIEIIIFAKTIFWAIKSGGGKKCEKKRGRDEKG
jgi:hypothetical protein